MEEIFEICRNRRWNVSITYQKINDYSVEIYTGYVSSYKRIFYSDGHISLKIAEKTAKKFLISTNPK